MSVLAQDMVELRRLSVGGAGALTDHLMHAVAEDLINEGVATEPVQPVVQPVRKQSWNAL
jgi:hypothetical protein